MVDARQGVGWLALVCALWLVAGASCRKEVLSEPAYWRSKVVSEAADEDAPGPRDFSQWRGPDRTGEILGVDIPDPLPKNLTKRWQIEIGDGHSTPVVGGDRVYVHSREGSEETIRCLSLEDGGEIWKTGHRISYSPNFAAKSHGKGPKATPLLSDGRLFTFGITGVLSSFRTVDGALLWRRHVADEYQESHPEFGAAASPLVDGGMVFMHVGGRTGGAMRAFDEVDGEARWSWDGDGPGYASPIIATLAGRRQLVTLSQNHAIGLAVESGHLLWEWPLETPYEQNIVTPLAVDGDVVVSGLEYGITAIRVEDHGADLRPRVLWHNSDVWMYMSSPIRVSDSLFGMSSQRQGQLFRADLGTGRVDWTSAGRLGENAALVKVGRLIWVLTTGGELLAFSPSVEGLEPVARYQVAQSPTWAHPVFIEQGVIIRDQDTLTRFDF